MVIKVQGQFSTSSNNLLPSLHTRDISTVMEHFEKCHYKHQRNITNWARGN